MEAIMEIPMEELDHSWILVKGERPSVVIGTHSQNAFIVSEKRAYMEMLMRGDLF